MVGRRKALLLFSLCFFFLSLPSLSSLSTFQTLIPTSHSLPSASPLSFQPESENSDSESLLGSESDSESSITLNLDHIDALSTNKTPQELFSSRLQLDSKRVKSIASLAAGIPRRNATHVPRCAGLSSSVVRIKQLCGLWFLSGKRRILHAPRCWNPDEICYHVFFPWIENEQTEISPKLWDGNGIPNSTTKYKEDQKVSWHGTPFEVRLDKALSEEGGQSLLPQRKLEVMMEETLQY